MQVYVSFYVCVWKSRDVHLQPAADGEFPGVVVWPITKLLVFRAGARVVDGLHLMYYGRCTFSVWMPGCGTGGGVCVRRGSCVCQFGNGGPDP